jgi:hypothetical protein
MTLLILEPYSSLSEIVLRYWVLLEWIRLFLVNLPSFLISLLSSNYPKFLYFSPLSTPDLLRGCWWEWSMVLVKWSDLWVLWMKVWGLEF